MYYEAGASRALTSLGVKLADMPVDEDGKILRNPSGLMRRLWPDHIGFGSDGNLQTIYEANARKFSPQGEDDYVKWLYENNYMAHPDNRELFRKWSEGHDAYVNKQKLKTGLGVAAGLGVLGGGAMLASDVGAF